MPKSLDKTKGARKRKKSPTSSIGNSESDGSETKKKKIQKKHTPLEGIEMSKQLAAEVQKKRINRSYNSSKKTNNEPRLLGNGKPMPSLAELEAMYADSDDDGEPSKQITTTSSAATTTTDRCSTPIQMNPILTDKININSPEILKKITSKVIDIISKKVVDLNDDGPPPPVIPQKKPKKGDKPYIVGCKDRPQVPWAPKTKFCVGSEEYGIDKNQILDEEEEKKRKKRGTPINISKSIFNAKSDEIAEKLKELDTFEMARTGSPDSNKTIEYDFPSNSPRTNMLRSFSPLPSTSKDSETILKNDKLFNESLQSESLPSEKLAIVDDSQDDVEIIDVPCETVVIDDTLPNINIKPEKRPLINLDDDCCIVEPDIKKKKYSENSVKDESPPKDDIYGSIDLTQTFDNEIYEIDDDEIDSLIAENKAILEKDLKKNSIDTVIAVDRNVIVVDPNNENSDLPINVSPSTSTANNSEVICYPPGPVECVELNSKQNNLPPTPASQSNRSEEISEVVTNFFNQAQNHNNDLRSNDNISTVDLTSSTSRDTMLGRISSWIYSIESYLTGYQNRRNLNSSNDVVIVDDGIPDIHSHDTSQGLCHHQRRGKTNCSCSIRSNANAQTFNNIQRNSSNYSAGSTCLTVGNNCGFPGPPMHDPGLNKREQDTQPLTKQQTQPSVETQPSPPHRSLGDCPICMDSLANSAVASTMCGHVFCMPCIKAAIRANGKKCPTCRKALKGQGGGYHQLFI